MPERAVVWEPLETDALLLDMALDRAGLVQASLYAEHERSFVTINDPVGFASYVAYAKSGRALREWYLPKGWLRDNSYNQVAIKHQKKMIRVVPCNFNEFVGDRFNDPTNKAPKGEISRKKSECNLSTRLPGFEPPVIDPELNDGYQTWLLGMYLTTLGRSVQSCPSQLSSTESTSRSLVVGSFFCRATTAVRRYASKSITAAGMIPSALWILR